MVKVYHYTSDMQNYTPCTELECVHYISQAYQTLHLAINSDNIQKPFAASGIVYFNEDGNSILKLCLFDSILELDSDELNRLEVLSGDTRVIYLETH